MKCKSKLKYILIRVKVKVAWNIKTQVKYRYSPKILKDCNKVLLLHYNTPLTVNNILNLDIFLTKMHRFATAGLYSTRGPFEALFIMDECTLLEFFWTVEQKHSPTVLKQLWLDLSE